MRQLPLASKANTCVNEIDLGHPGTLPSVNVEAVKKAIQACTALHLEIDPLLKFDRKKLLLFRLTKGIPDYPTIPSNRKERIY